MAVSADTYAPFDSGAGANVTEATWRKFMVYVMGRGAMASGVIRGIANTCNVVGDSSGMQVKARSGEVWIRGHWGEFTSEKTLPIAAADGTNPRKDLVVARAHFANNVIEYDVITGTPAASPTLPSPTQSSTTWEIPLAEVSVAAGAVTIASSNVQDGRRYVDNVDDVSVASADLTKNNNTTLSSVSGMLQYVSGGATYTVDGLFEYSADAAADAKWAISCPSGTTGRIGVGILDATTASITGSFAAGGSGVGVRLMASIRGTITIPNVAGAAGGTLTLQVQFAQNAAHASDAVFYAGSWLRLTRNQV